jgi:hypothetical protein
VLFPVLDIFSEVGLVKSAKSSSHQLFQTEIDSDNPCYRQLSGKGVLISIAVVDGESARRFQGSSVEFVMIPGGSWIDIDKSAYHSNPRTVAF